MKISIVLLGFLLISQSGQAQKPVDLLLKSSKSKDQASCFDIQLRSPSGHDIDLAGQNYRLFFDAKKLGFLADRITNHLDGETYSKIDLINTEDNDIGFVSMSIDGRALTKDIVRLGRDASWVKTLNICFDRLSDGPFDITWANANKTFSFATAEVAMSEWEDEENQQVLAPNEIMDFSSLVNDQEGLSLVMDMKVYPNPVVESINIDILGQSTAGTFIIKDVIGREVINERITDGVQQLHYDLNQWPEGTYTIVVVGDDGKRLASQSIVKITP